MHRIKKPKTRYELYKQVVMLYYRAAYDNIRAFTYDRAEKYRQRQKLKEYVQELLQQWEEIKL